MHISCSTGHKIRLGCHDFLFLSGMSQWSHEHVIPIRVVMSRAVQTKTRSKFHFSLIFFFDKHPDSIVVLFEAKCMHLSACLLR